MNAAPRQSYLAEALTEPAHGFALPVALLLAAYGVFSGRFGLIALAVILEVGYLLIYPLTPGFRRRCAEKWSREESDARRDELASLSARLSENARARLKSLERHRDNVLNQLRSWSGGASLESAWRPRLDELVKQGLHILIALDAFPPNPRAEHVEDGEIARLEKEIAEGHPGPARDAKEQRLRMLKARSGGSANLAEQREAAVVQLDTLEDLLEDLERAALAGRDAQAFGARLEQVNALVEAARQSVATLQAQAPMAAELAEAKRLGG